MVKNRNPTFCALFAMYGRNNPLEMATLCHNIEFCVRPKPGPYLIMYSTAFNDFWSAQFLFKTARYTIL